jgi:hypothetical protein
VILAEFSVSSSCLICLEVHSKVQLWDAPSEGINAAHGCLMDDGGNTANGFSSVSVIN